MSKSYIRTSTPNSNGLLPRTTSCCKPKKVWHIEISLTRYFPKSVQRQTCTYLNARRSLCQWWQSGWTCNTQTSVTEPKAYRSACWVNCSHVQPTRLARCTAQSTTSKQPYVSGLVGEGSQERPWDSANVHTSRSRVVLILRSTSIRHPRAGARFTCKPAQQSVLQAVALVGTS